MPYGRSTSEIYEKHFHMDLDGVIKDVAGVFGRRTLILYSQYLLPKPDSCQTANTRGPPGTSPDEAMARLTYLMRQDPNRTHSRTRPPTWSGPPDLELPLVEIDPAARVTTPLVQDLVGKPVHPDTERHAVVPTVVAHVDLRALDAGQELPYVARAVGDHAWHDRVQEEGGAEEVVDLLPADGRHGRVGACVGC